MTKLSRVLSLFTSISDFFGVPIYLKGGALRCVLEGKDDIPDGMDIDLVMPLPPPGIGMNSDFQEKLENIVDIMEMSKSLTKVDYHDDIPYHGMRFYRFHYYHVDFEQPIQVDLMLDELISDTVANMLRGKIENGTVVSVNSVEVLRLAEALQHVMNRILVVNDRLYSEMAMDIHRKYHIWWRVVHYLKKGWKFEHPRGIRTLPEWFVRHRPEILDEQKMCPLSSVNLEEVDWVAQPPCGHSFESEAYVAYCIKETPMKELCYPKDHIQFFEIGVACPVCGLQEPCPK